MTAGRRAQKNRFKQIFIDGWADFKQAHPRYATADPVVQKMLGGGDPANGYAGCPRSDGHDPLHAACVWQRLGYLPYGLLHRTWQTHVLQMIATRLARDAQAQRLVVEMQRRYPQGFVAYLQGDVRHRMKRLARYLAKVCGQPTHGARPHR